MTPTQTPQALPLSEEIKMKQIFGYTDPPPTPAQELKRLKRAMKVTPELVETFRVAAGFCDDDDERKWIRKALKAVMTSILNPTPPPDPATKHAKNA